METINPAIPTIKIQEPNYQEFILPSLGKLYGGRVPGGKIFIRPMMLREEEILATSRLAKSGESLKMVIANCVKIGIPPEELLSIDKSAILFWLRQTSYGNEYPVKIRCSNPDCNKEYDHVVNMEVDLTVKLLEDNLVEPFSVVLPKCKNTVKFRMSRWQDEDILAKRGMVKQKFDTTVTDRLSLLITEVSNIQKPMIKLWLEGLLAYDSSILKDAINKDYFGIDTKITTVCPECSTEVIAMLPINENFFRVYQKPS